MMTPAQRHYARKMAAQAAVEARTPANGAQARATAAASEYELQRARLGVDLRRLSEIQSIDRKIELKRELVPGYVDWVRGVLDADSGAADEVLVQVMIWSFDVGAWYDAMALGAYVLRHHLEMPSRFESTPGTFMVDTVADAAAQARKLKEAFPLDVLFAIEDLTVGEDMPDQARAKLLKEIGLLVTAEAEAMDPAADGPAGARNAGMARGLDYLRQALAKNSTVGVQKDITRLERELKKLEAVAAALAAAPLAAPADARAGMARGLDYLRQALAKNSTVGGQKDITRLERKLKKLETPET
jgi:hypothetical protein